MCPLLAIEPLGEYSIFRDLILKHLKPPNPLEIGHEARIDPVGECLAWLEEAALGQGVVCLQEFEAQNVSLLGKDERRRVGKDVCSSNLDLEFQNKYES